jgi:hypothetical protein
LDYPAASAETKFEKPFAESPVGGKAAIGQSLLHDPTVVMETAKSS